MARLFLFISVALLAACGADDKVVKQPEPQLVKSVVISQTAEAIQRSYPAKVIASEQVDLAFQVAGKIINLPTRRGEIVKKGQLLAALDERDFKNKFLAEQAKLQKADSDLKRISELLETGTVSQAIYDKAKADFEVATANTALSKKALEDTKLLAPYDGVIGDIFIENHQFIQAKQKIISIQDVQHIDIEVNLPEVDVVTSRPIKDHKEIQGVKVGYITLAVLPERKFYVAVKEYKTKADPVTQTYQVLLTTAAPNDINILPGMTATFFLDSSQDKEKSKVFLLPSHAVLTNEKGANYVWLIGGNGESAMQPVTTGKLREGKIEITYGLKQGDRVITGGASQLFKGMRVRTE